MAKTKETKNITLLLSDILKKDNSNLQELLTWFEVEEEDKTIPENYRSYEKEIKIVLTIMGTRSNFDFEVEIESESCPSVDNIIDELALDNEFWQY